MAIPLVDDIRGRLDAHFLSQVEVKIATPDESRWANELTTDHNMGPTAVCGWAWPLWNPDSENILVAYCPEWIARQCENLTDVQIGERLDIIEFVNDLMITKWDEEKSPWLKFKDVLDYLKETFPATGDELARWMLQANAQSA